MENSTFKKGREVSEPAFKGNHSFVVEALKKDDNVSAGKARSMRLPMDNRIDGNENEQFILLRSPSIFLNFSLCTLH